MRLIDADILYDDLGNKLTWLMGYGEEVYLTVGSDIKSLIDNQPTAYDVDKVVEQLQELADNHRQAGFDVERNGFSNVADKMYEKQCAFLQAIEIVKQGGVGKEEPKSDDVCEWTPTETLRSKGINYRSDGLYKPNCNNDEDDFRDWGWIRHFKHCPYCGKKIKVVE